MNAEFEEHVSRSRDFQKEVGDAIQRAIEFAEDFEMEHGHRPRFAFPRKGVVTAEDAFAAKQVQKAREAAKTDRAQSDRLRREEAKRLEQEMREDRLDMVAGIYSARLGLGR